MTGADDLYGLPFDRFVAERAALAKALRGEGRREEAARVARLRKPSAAAWSVNQLVRTQSHAVRALFDAGDGVQRAHSEVLAGRGAGRALREATQRERAAVDELIETARGLLSSAGHQPTQSTLDRAAETLHAAALDQDARARVRDGCLERELRRVGLGSSEAVSGPAPGGRGRGRDLKRSPANEHADRERADRERAERQRTAVLKVARKAEAAARRVAERTDRELETAQERRDRAAKSLRDTEEALAAAGERAEVAALEHRRAQQALERV